MSRKAREEGTYPFSSPFLRENSIKSGSRLYRAGSTINMLRNNFEHYSETLYLNNRDPTALDLGLTVSRVT